MIEILYKNLLTCPWKTIFNKFILFKTNDQQWFMRLNTLRNETWFIPAIYTLDEELFLPDINEIIKFPGMISPNRFAELRSFI